MSHILVVDDEKNIRKMVRLTLERAGHTLEIAEDGQRALEIFGDGAGWDLVLTDQRMPAMEGREVTLEMRRRDPAARIVMMTAFATDELAGEILRAGAVDFLRKPFSADTLRSAIAAALARPREELSLKLEDNQKTATPPRPMAMPNISYYLNGFTYWPVPLLEDEERAYHSFPVTRAFLVQTPGAHNQRRVVGITAHVQEIAKKESGLELEPAHAVWDTLCQGIFANYLWENAALPPEVLPIFELTSAQSHALRTRSRYKDEDD